MISFETGESVTYGLFNAQGRAPVHQARRAGVQLDGDRRQPRSGTSPSTSAKKKQLTNMRASGSTRRAAAGAPKQMSLEQCHRFLADDELLEVTPEPAGCAKPFWTTKRMKALHGKK